MQVSVENTGSLERKLTIRIPAGEFDTRVNSRLVEMSRSARLKGFRPGKVPVKVIEQRFGAQIRGETLSELVRTTFQQAVDEQKLRPAVAPSISTTGQPVNGEIEYTATFEVLPEMGRIDVSTLSVTKPKAEVAESDVDTMIDTLRQQRRTWAPVERAAQTGDMVLFEFSASADGVAFPEQGRERVGTIVGSGAMGKELEERLIGHAVDEEFETDATFPADFRIAPLAGKDAKLAVKIVRIQESKLPEVDDAFIATFGIGEGGMQKFRSDVRANLERELKSMLGMRLKNEVVNKLIEAHGGVEVPKGMVESEAQALAQQAQAQAQQQGQAIEANPALYL